MSRDGSSTGIRAVLLDIEGTTTPVSFVYQVLFPYVRARLRTHLEEHAEEAEYASLFERLHEEHESDRTSADAPPPWPEEPHDRISSMTAYLAWLMDRDRKSTALKDLQGRMWRQGYQRGELVAPVFPDVPVALERWAARNVRVAIFSSGSVLAQQLLFRHSTAGDLTRFLSGYFDTTTGPKSDPASYRRIADALSLQPGAWVFASDVVRELDAARAAGMQTRLAVRPGNAPQPEGHGHPVIQDFDRLFQATD